MDQKLFIAKSIIDKAEKDLGELSLGQKTDLLLDNMLYLEDRDEARLLVLCL